MRQFIGTLVIVCLLGFGPSAAAQPPDNGPRGNPGGITRVIRQVVKHLLAMLGDSLSPPHP